MRWIRLSFLCAISWLPWVPAHALEEGQEDYIRANAIFFVYHELGHALIDILQLPVFGQEEDAADVLGVILSEAINEPEDNAAVMLAAADNFAFMAEAAEAEGYDLAFWDTHDLDMQRYFTILCLWYGGDPEERQEEADELQLPEERQETCGEEYELAEASWGPVLEDISSGDGDADWMRFVVKSVPKGAAEEILLDAVRNEADLLSSVFSLEATLTIAFERCGEANAYYDPEDTQITICAELAELFTE